MVWKYRSLPEPKVEVAANIAGFSVTTDSVVATATVSTDGTMSRIVVDWGDGKTDTLRHRPGIEVTPVAGGDEPLPPGTYRFRHAYAEPEDRSHLSTLSWCGSTIAVAGSISAFRGSP